MTVYILLFRGVGGATQLPTAPLRAALTEAGFGKVATYINSGNAILSSRLSADKVVKQVAAICRENFDFNKAIYAIPAAAWDEVIAQNPFPDKTEPGNLLAAAWLDGPPAQDAVVELQALAVDGDGIAVVDNVAYLHTPNGFSKSKMAERFDKRIGVPNTARNWNTVLKLQALAKAAAD